MARPSHRGKILSEGLKVVHAQGFAGATVRDIVQAAGAPQGSFTNHFASKEAFGLEVLELNLAEERELIASTLADEAQSPLKRLEAYIDANARKLGKDAREGCLFGNLAAEVAGKRIRKRLAEIFDEFQGAIAACLKAAVRAGEAPSGLNCEATASVILASLQGAYLMAKVERDRAPVQRFKALLFSRILPAGKH